MVRRARLLVVFLMGVALITSCSQIDEQPLPMKALAVSEPVAAESPPPPPQDPCWDHDALEHGQGAPERQDWYNHLNERDYARAEMACAPYFWGTAEWECLNQLWQEESSWKWWIYGGIPQSMPETKMASHGADWRTNPRVQVRWGLDYIKNRPGYGRPTRATLKGTPCHAGY